MKKFISKNDKGQYLFFTGHSYEWSENNITIFSYREKINEIFYQYKNLISTNDFYIYQIELP